jgi:tRNA A37 methylthiotransferase MiaB
MKQIQNKFGIGAIYSQEDFVGTVYVLCCACMSVYSDFLSWANKFPERISKTPEDANELIVLGCQVTDLAVLNDLKNAENLYAKYNKPIYVGGCLAQRLDVDLPPYMRRLDVVREVNFPIVKKDLVNYAKPFWVNNFKENDNNLSDGNIFRNMYPLHIGAGCTFGCKYCTIRFTRGENYELNAEDQLQEFLNNENVVLISDSPTKKQISDWCIIAIEYNKEISIRNIEPRITMETSEELLSAAKAGVLKILHSPIQSCSSFIINKMGRNSYLTNDFLSFAKELRSMGVIVATNIIIDYEIDGVIYPNHDKELMNSLFDYYSWNPYWDGVWNRERAEKRFEKYIGGN